MYPSYPNDPKTQMGDTCARAVEGQQYHMRMQAGSITVSCTANTLSTASATFPAAFSSLLSIVYSIKTIGSTASTVKFTDVTASDSNGFTLRVMSDTAQNIVFSYIALGTAE